MSVSSAPPLSFGLTDRTWATMLHVDGVPDMAGTLSNTARLRLPPNEQALAAGDGFVVSAIYARPVTGPGTTILLVRELASGQVVVQLSRPGAWVMPDQLALVSGVVYFAMRPDAASEQTGVYELNLRDGSVRTLIEPDLPRLALAVNGAGRTLVSEAVADGGTDLVADVLDTASSARSRVSVQGAVRFVSDAQVFTTGNAQLYAYQFSTGQLDWVVSDITVDRGYVTSDGALLVVQTGLDPDQLGMVPGMSSNGLRPRVIKVDTATGVATTLVEGTAISDAQYLWVQLSNDHVGALIPSGHHPAFAFESGQGRIALTVIDLYSGAQSPNAATVIAP